MRGPSRCASGPNELSHVTSPAAVHPGLPLGFFQRGALSSQGRFSAPVNLAGAERTSAIPHVARSPMAASNLQSPPTRAPWEAPLQLRTVRVLLVVLWPLIG